MRRKDEARGRESRRVAAELRVRMADGGYPPDTLLPSQHELATEFGVSRDTVQRVLRRGAGADGGARVPAPPSSRRSSCTSSTGPRSCMIPTSRVESMTAWFEATWTLLTDQAPGLGGRSAVR
ncbi:GntR family transcriptional regulator [Streptomyces collinus]|uniref:GntR family transcriptional regulator n=1 Tax=Streptomyces collinus TaxID=42684 RepID=UPI00367D9171